MKWPNEWTDWNVSSLFLKLIGWVSKYIKLPLWQKHSRAAHCVVNWCGLTQCTGEREADPSAWTLPHRIVYGAVYGRGINWLNPKTLCCHSQDNYNKEFVIYGTWNNKLRKFVSYGGKPELASDLDVSCSPSGFVLFGAADRMAFSGRCSHNIVSLQKEQQQWLPS